MTMMLAEIAMLTVIATLKALMPLMPARFVMTIDGRCYIDGRRRDKDRRGRAEFDKHIDAGKCRCCGEQTRYCNDSQNAFHGSSPLSPNLI